MSQWQGLVHDFSHTLTLRDFWVLLFANNFFLEEGVYTPGISGCTYAMKLKLTPGMALDKRSWLITHLCHVTRVYFSDQKPFLITSAKMIDDVINQLLWSRTLPRVSFNLFTCFEPVKQIIIIFIQKLWFVNPTLGQERYVYACAEGSVTKFFYPKMFQRKILFTGTKFHAKLSRSFGLI